MVYIRLFPEMNGHWNPYSAFNANGSARGASHSTKAFRNAWRRIVLIVRGGSRRSINHRLREARDAADLPRELEPRSDLPTENVPEPLPKPRVAFMWVPQTIGSPALGANKPGRYWPGGGYVDWIGADIYSKFATPGIWAAFKRFYSHWRTRAPPLALRGRRVLAVGQRLPRGFTRRLFNWALHNRRVRALVYYRSVTANNPFDINNWPAAQTVLRSKLNSRRFRPYAPGTRP